MKSGITLKLLLQKFFLPACILLQVKGICATTSPNINNLLNHYDAVKTEDSLRAEAISEILNFYIHDDYLNDSLLMWIDSLKDCKGKSALQNSLQAQLFKGKYFLRKVEFAKALEEFYSVLLASKRNNLQSMQAAAYLQIGVVFYTQKQFNDALENFSSSLKVYEKLKDNYRVSMLTYLTGTTLVELNRLDEAYSYLNNAIEKKIVINDKKGEYESKMAMARLYFMQGNYKEAESLYNDCLNYFNNGEDFDALSFVKMSLARVMLKTNKQPLAEQLLLQSLHIADSLHYNERKIAVLHELKDFYISSKAYEKAVHYQTEYYQLKDSVFNFDNAKTISTLKAKIEADKKQAQIELLQHKEKVSRTQRILGIVFILFLLAYMYNLYKRFTFKKKAEEILAKTNKELEKTIVDLQDKEHELIHAEKMASMGRLTSGIAHELRNPLNFVSNFSNISEELLTELNDNNSAEDKQETIQQLKYNLGIIQTHSKRADNIIRNMLQLSRKSSTERTHEQLNKLVEDFVKIELDTYEKSHPGFHCDLQFNFDNTIEHVEMNSHEITHVIVSITHNAFDAMHEKTKAQIDYTPCLIVTTERKNNMATVSITDNGVGIPGELLHKVFEPFYSTKPIDKGTGLGLSLSYDFIKVHKGSINATSSNSQTTFTFSLPLKSSQKSNNYSKQTHIKN